MKDKRCFICKYHGITNQQTSRECIFRSNKNLSILLCYNHSVELFKTGQTKFMAKYRPDFMEFTSADEDRAILSYF